MSEAAPEQQQEQPAEVQPSEVELQAMEYGWKPEADFKADPTNEGKKWRTAEDFMDRKSLFDRIEGYNKQVREMKRGMDALAAHNKKIEQSAYERALAELRAERNQALENDDHVTAEKIRDRIDDIKEQQRMAPPVQPQPQVNPELVQWVERNKWYTSDVDMRAFAEGYASQLWNSGVRDSAEALAQIERKVREVFPTKFRNPNKDRSPSLEGGQRKVGGKSDDFKLTAEEEKIMQTMIRAGAPISKEDYLKQIRESRS